MLCEAQKAREEVGRQEPEERSCHAMGVRRLWVCATRVQGERTVTRQCPGSRGSVGPSASTSPAWRRQLVTGCPALRLLKCVCPACRQSCQALMNKNPRLCGSVVWPPKVCTESPLLIRLFQMALLLCLGCERPCSLPRARLSLTLHGSHEPAPARQNLQKVSWRDPQGSLLAEHRASKASRSIRRWAARPGRRAP